MNRYFVYEHCNRHGIKTVSVSLETPHASAECEYCDNGHDFFEKFDCLEELQAICNRHKLDYEVVLDSYAYPFEIPMSLHTIIETPRERITEYTAVYSKNRYG
ncbi:hypothetical protein vBAbaMPhT2_185 [Acinetobacter phage vB_AbaM_PhT2]|uniref:Uncharacterized protein n=1 Tax=Acinetobacter phage vB_AbaM_PhT2 TaxID=2690230 RepID=A0A6B9SZA6_9CAUD|nr:hypothetical protein HYQ24_gp246 [Acinetobacter phage vB_AbaM_PhT2]QHJ75795.1 hypothetical protein vBAbaMPhT2_185 [Acinetobacter phage vB_AbaM_PhT2]